MKKRKVMIFSTISVAFLIGIIVYFQFQHESPQEEIKRVKSAMEQVRNNPEVFDQVSHELKANGFEVLEVNSVQYTPENGGEFIIKIPKIENDKTSAERKKGIKKIAKNVLAESDISELNLLVKVKSP